MASSSGGVTDLLRILKSITTTINCQLAKNDLEELITIINKRENDIFNHDVEYNVFYTTMAALSAECISASIYTLCKSQFGAACRAAKILLKYLLQTLCSSHTKEPSSPPCGLTAKQLLIPIKSLCSAQSLLPASDRVALQTLLKDVKIHLIKQDIVASGKDLKKSRTSFNATFVDQLTSPMYDFSIVKWSPSIVVAEGAVKNSESSNETVGKDIEKLFIQTNIESLQFQKAGEMLITMCMESPYLVRYVQKYRDTVSSGKFILPTNSSEANAIIRHNLQALANDIHLVWSALSLPIFEPLDNIRLERLTELSMTCLYCALYISAASSIVNAASVVSPKCPPAGTNAPPSLVNTANSNANNGAGGTRHSTSDSGDDTCHDGVAVGLIEKTLEIHKMISEILQGSARAGGVILQNYRLISVWVLLSGLQGQLSLVNVHPVEKTKDDKGKSPKPRESMARISFIKIQHGFGVLSVALSTLCLNLMATLLDDLLVESVGLDNTCVQPEIPVTLSIFEKYTALQRAAKCLAIAPISQILFNLAAISCRKAYTLKRAQKSSPGGSSGSGAGPDGGVSRGGPSGSFTDSTIYFEDDMMSLEFSSTDDDEDDEEDEEDDDADEEEEEDEDEDSDRILGQWFELTLTPPSDGKTNSQDGDTNGQQSAETASGTSGGDGSKRSGLVPDKTEPHGYIILATKVFQFMNKHFLNKKSPYLWSHIKSSLTEQQMIILAAIIKDLDRETARTETGTIPVSFGATLGSLYSEFSQALTRFTHNALVCEILSGQLKTTLLTHLGVNPWVDEVRTWPLQVHPRTLAVLAQILLLTQDSQEKERAIIEIWHKLVNELMFNILHPNNNSHDPDFDDLNVEHAQLVLFFFHSLNLMQKKSSLMFIASTIVHVVDELESKELRDSQILHLSRLLLLLEYLMRHLYDAPSVLTEQIEWNLFTAPSVVADGTESSQIPTRVYCPWKEIDDNYRKHVPAEELTMKPRFYSLTNVEVSNQDQPKLDGLACNFLLGTPDKLKYTKFAESLISILSVTDKSRWKKGMSFTGFCAVQYCFAITWRFLQLLPPSYTFLESLVKGEEPMEATNILYTLVWGPRTGYKTFVHWLKDCLVRQSKQVPYAETLLKNVAKVVTSLNYDINLAKSVISRLTPDQKSVEHPSVTDLCTLDAVIAKIQVLLDESITKAPDALEKSSSPVESPPTTAKLIEGLLPYVIALASSILSCCRSNLLNEIQRNAENKSPVTSESSASANTSSNEYDQKIYEEILSMASRWNTKTGSLGLALMSVMPAHVRTVAEKWDSNPPSEFPWNTYANDIIPAESYILAVVNTHITAISSQGSYSNNPSLQHLLNSSVTFISEHFTKCSEFTELIKMQAIDVLVPITMECCTQYLHTIAQRALEKIIGDAENELHQRRIYYTVLEHTYRLIFIESPSSVLDNSLRICLKFIEEFLDSAIGRQTLNSFFVANKRGTLVKILLTACSPYRTRQYSSKVYRFFIKLLTTAEKNPGDSYLENLCKSLSELSSVHSDTLLSWLRHLILGGPSGTSSSASTPVQVEPPSTSSTTNNSKESKEETSQTAPQKNENNTSKDDDKNNKSASNESSNDELKENDVGLQTNYSLLQALTTYLTKEQCEKGPEISKTLLRAMISIGEEILLKMDGVGFCNVIVVMASLAGAGKCHMLLVNAAIEWLQIVKHMVSTDEEKSASKSERTTSSKQHQQRPILDAGVMLLTYIGDVVLALTPAGCGRASSPPWEGDTPPLDYDPDYIDDPNVAQDEDDSAAEDSDEDNLSSRLCTFTITAKEFMNQHWYHCHTCGMVEGVGVCTVCARVCHRGHDVTYAKYGNFFCDCGAKTDGSCQALRQRSPQQQQPSQPSEPIPGPSTSTQAAAASASAAPSGGAAAQMGLEQMLPSSLRRRPSSPVVVSERSDRSTKDRSKITSLAKQIEPNRDQLLSVLTNASVVTLLLDLVKLLLPKMKNCDSSSPIGCHERALNEMCKLHLLEKTFEETDQLMLPTLGSQEGAFENVKMNYSGEQGQLIRQLISSHMVRRVAMCCMSSPHGKRQHLAVSHEKGKITVLQLSALLKQADSSKRKLTLTRLASAPIPFTVLSITGNPCNEDFLAVCGIRECHVVTFTSGGLVADHLVLHPMLETGNFIIKAIWLPGSQTELALVTAEFIKIYDLSKDAVNPKHFFLVPAGKVRDCTFYCNESYPYNYILVMTSAGYICMQEMSDDTLAVNGPFFMMDVLENFHAEVKELQGQVEGGGVSIYYSHALQLLFFSYSSGKSFVAPLPKIDKGYKGLPMMFLINWAGNKTTGTSNGSGKSNTQAQLQPLCQWNEVPNHPGLVFSVMMTSNNPVILMIRPDRILVQEIKVVPAKAKIMDMVAIRHPSSNAEHRTTLILLCEDGSLRIYMASMQNTGFWMSSTVQAMIPAPAKAPKKRKATVVQSGKQTGSVTFPVDFFEHCQEMKDVEFGGNDLLQVYNTQQIKHRLNTPNMNVVSAKQAGFSVEITNNDPSLVMTGIRVSMGTYMEQQRSPAFIEIFGRSIHTVGATNRWFDFPFTREESLLADRRITITFGPSQDPDCFTAVDSIKVYGKVKDSFGWPEEAEEIPNNLNGTSTVPSASSSAEGDSSSSTLSPHGSVEKVMSSLLEVLEGCFTLITNTQSEEYKAQMHPQRDAALAAATSLMTLPTSVSIQLHAKFVLAALFPTKFVYHFYKDIELLRNARKIVNQFIAMEDPKQIDPEAFYRTMMTIRSIAVARPYNFTRFFDVQEKTEPLSPKDTEPIASGTGLSAKASTNRVQFMTDLMTILWRLVECAPKNVVRAPVCKPGLTHTDAVVQGIVEIFHAFTCCDADGTINEAARYYTQLLLSDNLQISFSAKQALVRVLRPRIKQRRRVFIPSPPHCSTPGGASATLPDEHESNKGPPVHQPSSQDLSEADPSNFDADAVEPMVLMADEVNAAGALDAILGVPGAAFPPIIDIPPDADDETMVELAIALSLQEGNLLGELPGEGEIPAALGNLNLQGAAAAIQGLHVLAAAGQQAQVAGVVGHNPEAGHYSDTTASAGGSDDEGSTAATDGSTLRTSPAEPAQGGSESGGSGVESIVGEQNVSGRSSAYGDSQEPSSGNIRTDPVTSVIQENENETDTSSSLHELRLTVLQQLIDRASALQNHDGVHVLPFMQVLLTLTSDLDGVEAKDKIVLENLLRALDVKQPVEIAVRNPLREVHLVILRLLSVLMSRSKNSMKSSFVSKTTAQYLLNSGAIGYCYVLLESLLKYWKTVGSEEGATPSGGALLKPHLTSSPPDMSPFFLRQYVKGHANDVFEAYPHLLTEMALRLPLQIQKHLDSVSSVQSNFGPSWYSILCEFMMTHQTPFVRRQVRKLLMYLCGHKEKYRHLRDIHSLESHMKAVTTSCANGGYVPNDPNCHISLNYDALVELIEHLKECVEVATYRTSNWQSFCTRNEDTLITLFELSTLLDDGVCPTVLQLLQCALCSKTLETDGENKSEEDQSVVLVRQLNKSVSPALFSQFLRIFLLETNATAVRWQAHALILAIYRNSPPVNQEIILDLMWALWPQLPAYGRKTAQFVDILGYFSLNIASSGKKSKLAEYTQQAVDLLRKQNYLLAHHPNANIYTSLAQFVELDGYYLESEPCLVCNSPEVPMSSIKLSAIKIDSKFTTTAQFVKLVSSHTISKITLRIGDLKRTKMVRTINVYYNNRSAQAVVQLKNKATVWHKAKKVSLVSGQTEVKMEFPLPIVACNLMIEYADFYENVQVATETLQCPRCSASVPANPGVCGNCGENVFQCHKCRAINYDEKDPFLCHSCGFCKYAKFEYVLTARPCCAVDPIETDEDRNKTVAAINSALEKADRVYRSIIANKPCLEIFLMRINEPPEDKSADMTMGSIGTGTSLSSAVPQHVSKVIQLLAQRYCGECKNSFDELSKLVQRVVASRRELVAYDRDQREKGKQGSNCSMYSSLSLTRNWQGTMAGRCYGCATAAADHCLTMLKALASNPTSRQLLCQEGLIEELVKNNLRKGTHYIQDLLCLLTRDNPKATHELCALLIDRIALVLRGHVNNSDMVFAVRHEMSLLAALVEKEDTCWESKLRCVMALLFLANQHADDPVVLRWITLPCQEILYGVMRPAQPTSKKNNEKTVEMMATVKPEEQGIRVNVFPWIRGDLKHSYAAWRKRMPAVTEPVPAAAPPSSSTAVSTPSPAPEITALTGLSREEIRALYLMERYGTRWRRKALRDAASALDLNKDAPWLKRALFNPSSPRHSRLACFIIECIWQVPVRKKEIMDLLTGYLSELGEAGESASRFISLYQNLLKQVPWKQYLVVKGILLKIADLLTHEIEAIHRLEDSTLTSDLAQGYALKMLTELLASFLDHDGIKQLYKGRLVGAVLNGYLSLRRLVVQRTRLIDDTQDKLLELLEEMTSGTEEETKAFMAICIETAKKQNPEDIRTPVFIFERLCSIIYPEESDTGEFFLTLDKDPQQEDFLQGRMLGNPYSSNEPGMGPLMRDVKNKICQDCELVALLEDDNGMELLVNNKIISLNLPVREVWKRVWCNEGGDNETMRVVYRMRGLLGDATEEFVETLNDKIETEVNNEEVYKMANVMADCGGLEIMLDRMSHITDLTRARPLLQVLLKLFRLCVKVKQNQEVLAQPKLNAIGVFLNVLQKLCSSKESSASQASITEQLLDIMETILSKATSDSADKFYHFSTTFGGVEHIEALLTFTATGNGKNTVLPHVMRVLAALTYGNETRMAPLISHFTPLLDFNAFDADHPTDDEAKMELFCELTKSIERNAIGSTLKDYINSLGIVQRALEYIETHAPPVEVCRTDSDDWKEFISKPSLKYILRFLTGLATGHERTQVAIAEKSIRIIHQLEQVSSDDHVGSLAENLLEALKTGNEGVAVQIEEVRNETRAEKKRKAMAMRERQLGVLGMRTNDKGQVTADSTIMQQVEDLGEETGHVCVICREGYKFQPTKVLGIYTFSKRCNVDDYEAKTRKTVGYTTVTHFNIVHVDCHMAAVRLARIRDEWESAALQNANTKCNGLLPLWGPQVPESAYANCLARHNTYLQDCTGHRDISYNSMVHDLKLLLLRFAQERSFHDDTGGGGPQSNMYIIPYLLHMALYVINSTRSAGREEKQVSSYIECRAPEKWVESCYEADGPLYVTALSLLLVSPARWQRVRLSFLLRLLVLAQVRHLHPSAPPPSNRVHVADAVVKDYAVYKPYLVFFALIDGIYKFFKKITVTTEEQWPSQLADYIRHNDEALMKASDRLLSAYRDEFLPCASFDEFCDVLELLEEIPEPSRYLSEIITSLAFPFDLH